MLTTADRIRSLVVLRLANLSRDSAQAYFADGMTEALISALGRLKPLRVISHTSTMKYKRTSLALPEIARELNVDAVLEGSALLPGSRVRIRLNLVTARSDDALWTQRYDRGLEDVRHGALGHADLSNLELSSGIRALQRATGLMLLRVHRRMDAIRGDARYSALVQKLGLVGDSRSPHALPATA